MNNKRFIKYTSGMTAFVLALSLGMGGCSSAKSSFDFTENENGEIVVVQDSYIEYDYLDKYCVLELYNTVTNQNEIYIVHKIHHYMKYSPGYYEYQNVFNNYSIFYENEENIYNGLKYVKETPLFPYITSYYTIKARYTYEDMEKILEIIKENYIFENDESLRRKLVIDNRL